MANRVAVILKIAVALARLALSISVFLLYYTMLRLRLWARRKIYRIRFTRELKRAGFPRRLRGDLAREYEARLRELQLPGLRESLRLFKRH